MQWHLMMVWYEPNGSHAIRYSQYELHDKLDAIHIDRFCISSSLWLAESDLRLALRMANVFTTMARAPKVLWSLLAANI